LIADDEPTNRSVLRDLLEPIGFVVTEVADGAACIAAVNMTAFDALLLDLRMPELGGLEALPRLRTLQHGRALPIIAVSASVLGFDQNEAIAAGCNDFLPKPVQEAQLLDSLARALRLDWIVRESAGPFDTFSTDPSHELPSLPMLDAMIAIARRGDVDGLREQIAVALTQGEKGPAFLRDLDQLASGFKTAEIRRRLTDARTRLVATTVP
jgi:CheY-like chemotaxis protein